ncbi:MAG: molybdate ABC transporter permease subunit [Chloroflexota bacterium]|nr:molybdate ABC transporter permease subunit [Chloroflexota bacterium]
MDWDALRLSLLVGVSATALSVLLGLPAAWLLARKRFPGRRIASALVLAPVLLPPTVLGYYLLQAVGRRSLIGGALDDLFGFSPVFHWTGAALAAFVVSAPFLIRTAQAGFEAIEPLYEEAARASGANEPAVFLRVTLPLAWPSVAAGAAMAFARAIGEFGATLMVAGSVPGRTRTLPIAIYEAAQTGRAADALAMSLLLTFAALGIILIAAALPRARRR